MIVSLEVRTPVGTPIFVTTASKVVNVTYSPGSLQLVSDIGSTGWVDNWTNDDEYNVSEEQMITAYKGLAEALLSARAGQSYSVVLTAIPASNVGGLCEPPRTHFDPDKIYYKP